MSIKGHLGAYLTSGTRTHVRFQFSTHAAAGGNVAPSSAFEAADVRIYRANDSAAFSATQRSSAAGITMTSPFDTLTGVHDLDIDLADNTDAGFYAAGYFYSIILAPDETVDSQTITGVVLATFEIGVPTANVTQFGGTAITSSGGRPEVNTTHAAGTAWGSGAITAASIAADAITAAKVADGTIDAATFAAGAINAAAIAADAITDAKVASDVTIASVTGAVGSVTGNVGGNVVGSVGSVTGAVGSVTGNVGGSVASVATGGITRASFAADTGLQTVRSNTAQAGAAGTITLDASASATDDIYNDHLAYITGGTGVGQIRFITDYVGSTKVATVKPNWTTNPDNTSTFAIVPAASVWDQVTADHVDSGSTGNSLNAAGSAGDPWSTSLPGSYGAGTAGKIVGDNIDATVSSRQATIWSSAGATVNLSATTIKTLTDAPADSSGITTLLSRIPSGIFTGMTSLAQWLGLLGGKQTGNATALTEIKATGAGSGTYDPTTDSMEALRDRGDAAWVTGGGGSITDLLNVTPLIPPSIDLANTASWRIGLQLTNGLDDLPTTAEITPGTISIDVKAIGATSWTSIVADSACSEAAGLIYFDEVFDAGTGYAEGQSVRITFKSQKITVSANDYEISDSTGRIFYAEIRQTERGTNSASTHSAADVWASGTRTLTALDEDSTTLDLDSTIRTAVGMASPNLDTQLATIDDFLDTEIAAIKAKTDTLPTFPTNFAALLINASGHISRVTLADTLTTYTGNTPQTGDNYARLGAPAGASIAADIATRATPAQVNAEVLDVLNVDTLIDGKTIIQSQIYCSAILAGRISGAGTGTEVFKGLDEATTRVTVTVDGSGNRTDIVYG